MGLLAKRVLSPRAVREARGRKAERLAAWYLRFKGWKVLDRRVRTVRGEIDLIARRGDTVAFVEVKWRERGDELGLAIDRRRLERVEAAMAGVAHRYVPQGCDQRIDVVLLAPGQMPRHIVNATLN